MFWKKRTNDDRPAQRRRMIDDQIRSRGVVDEAVLAAMLEIPREAFVPESLTSDAYADRALPIGHGQTISQPYIVAFMTEKLSLYPGVKALEVGTGTGYQTAVLARLCRTVHTVERIDALQKQALENFARLGLTNVFSSVGDGSLGLRQHAPFDRIMVTAAAPSVPTALLDQLAEGGVLVAPVGGEQQQTLVRVVRKGTNLIESPLLACRFVKLVGSEGWSAAEA